MSIWCSWNRIGAEPGSRRAERGEVRSYALGWSNHYPDRRIERPASVDVAHIPVWCVPGHRDDGDDDTFGEWLRLSVTSWKHDWENPRSKPTERTSLDVVMDEDAVRALRDDLTAWLEQPKARRR